LNEIINENNKLVPYSHSDEDINKYDTIITNFIINDMQAFSIVEANSFIDC